MNKNDCGIRNVYSHGKSWSVGDVIRHEDCWWKIRRLKGCFVVARRLSWFGQWWMSAVVGEGR